ncbi:MAG: rubredoxin, partial [Leptospira sp.]|nr:rubredoxin [Leptospira sp.]
PEKEILPGTQFPDLPSSFGCFVCDSPKSNFKEISLASLQ